MHEHGHALMVAGFGLLSCGRPGTGAGSCSFRTGLGLDAGGDGNRRDAGIEFETAAGEFLIGSPVLEKDDLAERLPAGLKKFW